MGIFDDILYKILSQVCIYSGSESIKNLKEILNREFSYNSLKQIDYLLKDVVIENKIFDNEIIYNINIDNELLDKIKLISNVRIEIISEVYF